MPGWIVSSHPAGRFFIFACDKQVLAGPTEQCKAMIKRSAFFIAQPRTSLLSSFCFEIGKTKRNNQQEVSDIEDENQMPVL